MATKKAAAKKPATTKAKVTPATKKPATKKPAVEPSIVVPDFFVAPHWGNVVAPDPALVPTGDAALDAALTALFAGTASAADEAVCARAPVTALIANYRGAILENTTTYWNDDLVDTLSPADERAQKKVYWAADAAMHARANLVHWFTTRLATSPEGCDYLIGLLASRSTHAAGVAATVLRAHRPDAALLPKIVSALDPARPLVLGVMAQLALAPDDAFAKLAPHLALPEGADVAAVQRAETVCYGIEAAITDWGIDPQTCARFIPALAELVGADGVTKHRAIGALLKLPPHPAAVEAARTLLGPSPSKVDYWHDDAVKLIATSSDPAYIPWLAAALGNHWGKWPSVFTGLGKIGDPIGIAIIEAWLENNSDASDRVEAATPILASLRERGGEPTAEHRALAIELLDGANEKTTKKKKRA